MCSLFIHEIPLKLNGDRQLHPSQRHTVQGKLNLDILFGNQGN